MARYAPRDAERRRLLLDRSVPGRTGCTLPSLDVPLQGLPPQELLREDLVLPEVTEGELVRYFVYLSQLNFAVDLDFYPLGSCTMKYNPKWHEDAATLPGLARVHPLQPPETSQGALQLMFELQELLARITGMDAVSLAPAAGAQGELAGMLLIHAYHKANGDTGRGIVLVPDSAHGTNPASAAMVGYQVVAVPSDAQGNTDLEALRSAMSPEVASIMLTLPNTLGLFDPHILEVCRIVHQGGGLVYGDGANLNALLGQARFGDLGFDVVHLNLHKTFSTPHGGGGPGAGPVAVKKHLAPFLPTPVVERRGTEGSQPRYLLAAPPQTVGKVSAFHGNFGVMVKAYAYIRTLGDEGLREISENAVINANYLREHLQEDYRLPYPRRCMHEVVLSASRQRAKGASAMDVAKRLIDYGFHPPTTYFPLVVEEALMIEPTETESKETLDAFMAAMKAIAKEVERDPQSLKDAPHHAPVDRLDEATAARKPDLRWRPRE